MELRHPSAQAADLIGRLDHSRALSEEEQYDHRAREDNEEGGYGLRTTSTSARSSLEHHGYTIRLLSEIYSFFEPALQAQVNYSIERVLVDQGKRKRVARPQERESRTQRYLSRFPVLSKEAELGDFVTFLRELLRPSFNQPPFDRHVAVRLADGKRYRLKPDEHFHLAAPFEDVLIMKPFELEMYLFSRTLEPPPWILKIAALFETHYFQHYSDVIIAAFVRLILETVEDECVVTLDVSAIMEPDPPSGDVLPIGWVHGEMQRELIDKVSLYGRVFGSLFKNEEQIRARYAKTECRSLLIASDNAVTTSDKGEALERLTEALFTSSASLEVVSKRLSIGDEEIDIVVKNNIAKPFWQALQSAVFFVECKNWQKKIGARELRDFEGKLRNHHKLAKVGFFVSVAGFSRHVRSELRRGSRDSQHIVLIDRSDIVEFIESSTDLVSWLESRAARFY